MKALVLPIVLGLLALTAASSGAPQAKGSAVPAPPPSSPSSTAPAPLDPSKVEAFVDGAVAEAMRADHIAGVTVAIVDRSGVVLTKGYGVASLSPRRDVDADTLFRVGSISKTPVWVSLMQLVEQGRIGLDDPINDHLPPDLRIPDEGFRQPIRVWHLMTHSPGFEDSVLGGFFVRNPEQLAPLDVYLRRHRVHRVREPGKLAVYSNYGAALAAAIVAHVSGQGWQDYVEQHVLRPLGMTTATYREPYPAATARARGLPSPMPAATAARVSSGFDLKAGALAPQPFEYVTNVAPAGAMSASANDMAAYMIALLDPARLERAGVLRAATFQTMRQPLLANSPELGSWRHGFMDFTAAKGRPAFGHGGDLIFQHSTMEIYPDAGIGVFVSVNTPTGEPLRETLSTALMAAFAGPTAALPARPDDAAAEARRVAGTYRALRIPTHRTEHAVLALFATGEIKALPGGDIAIPQGDGRTERFRAIGQGVFAEVDGQPARIAFHEVGGRMMRFDPFSAGPAVRVGFFQSANWLLALAVAGALTAVWGVVMGARRLFGRRSAPDGAAANALDGLCLVWLIALGLAVGGAAALGGPNEAVFTYPGPLLPIGLWALAIAAIATLLAAIAVIGPLRPAGWRAWRWTRGATVLAVFAVLSATLYGWGLLGYSGW
jgi:CubicO group peptidase (beta-lactamase class C family)